MYIKKNFYPVTSLAFNFWIEDGFRFDHYSRFDLKIYNFCDLFYFLSNSLDLPPIYVNFSKDEYFSGQSLWFF